MKSISVKESKITPRKAASVATTRSRPSKQTHPSNAKTAGIEKRAKELFPVLPFTPQDEADHQEVDKTASNHIETLKLELVSPWGHAGDDAHKEIVERNGDPFKTKKDDGPSGPEVVDWDTHYWGARYAHENLVLFDPGESVFYRYNETSGVWCSESDDELRADVARYLLKYSKLTGEEVLMHKRHLSKLNEMMKVLKSTACRFKVFPKLEYGVLHLANGMLHLDCSPPALRDFSHIYYSRCQCSIPYDPQAKCPRFLNDLVLSAIDQDDADLLQLFCGMFLLGRNLNQRFLILSGEGGSGKGTIVRIIEEIVGEQNVKELRTEHSPGRFENDDLGKVTLLIGSDVDADFLSNRGASVIKKITGGDKVASEKKGGRKTYVTGEHNVLIVSNCTLQVKLQGDVKAWNRRMHIIDFDHALAGTPIVEFDKVLMEQEASGILNWFIEGAVKILELSRGNKLFPVTIKQGARVQKLLDASDSLKRFVTEGLRLQMGSSMTSDELFHAYENFCADREWEPKTKTQCHRKLPLLMKKHHNVTNTHDLKRDGKAARGYKKIALVDSIKVNTLATSSGVVS
jgi:P4 family phage/plasmid primase-like protien